MKKTFNKYAAAFLLFGMMATSCNAQKQETTELSGYTIGYNSNTGCGCFYVDKEMVEAGVAKDISDKADKVCSSGKYGLGAPISFQKVPSNADYTTPAENTLMIFTGYWAVQGGKNTFFATKVEPFF